MSIFTGSVHKFGELFKKFTTMNMIYIISQIYKGVKPLLSEHKLHQQHIANCSARYGQ